MRILCYLRNRDPSKRLESGIHVPLTKTGIQYLVSVVQHGAKWGRGWGEVDQQVIRRGEMKYPVSKACPFALTNRVAFPKLSYLLKNPIGSQTFEKNARENLP